MSGGEIGSVRLKVTRQSLDGREVIGLSGPFNAVSDRLLELAREIIAEGKREIVLDLGDVSFMTSQGIGCTIKLLKLVQNAQGALYIAKPKADMVELFKTAHIDRYLVFLD